MSQADRQFFCGSGRQLIIEEKVNQPPAYFVVDFMMHTCPFIPQDNPKVNAT